MEKNKCKGHKKCYSLVTRWSSSTFPFQNKIFSKYAVFFENHPFFTPFRKGLKGKNKLKNQKHANYLYWDVPVVFFNFNTNLFEKMLNFLETTPFSPPSKRVENQFWARIREKRSFTNNWKFFFNFFSPI